MIIDDDEPIRARLKNIVEWEENDISLVCEAQDSDTARELFLLYRPKIIITDIHIPIISGLDLAYEIARINPEVRFIIITGYSDFEYVKASVKLGAVDLISKPIIAEEINSSLRKAVEYFNELKREKTSSENMKKLLEESLPIYCERFIHSLFNQTARYSEARIFEKFDSLGLDIKGSYYHVVLLSPSVESLSASEKDLSLFATKNICDELLCNAGFKAFSFFDGSSRINCLISSNKENGNLLLEEAIQEVHDKMVFYWNINIYAGISIPITDITNLYHAKKQAETALSYQGILLNGPVVNYTNISGLDMPVIEDKADVISTAIKCIKTDSMPELNELVQKELSSLFSSGKDILPTIRKFIFELVSSIVAESISMNINPDAVLKNTEIYEKIFSVDSVPLLTQCFLDFAGSISRELLKKQSETKNMLIRMAKDFIMDSLSNERLNLEMVSDHIGLSSIYFCKLFHKEEGMTFNNYLNMERVGKAKTLLRKTSMKVFEIGYATGYSNPKYFNYVFKRIADVTPLEYRNSNIL